MNLIYLHTHDSGRFIQPYGYGIPTPNLMRLAKEGALFQNASCAAPTCSPSRAAMLTGMNAHQCGITGLVHRGFSLNDNQKHLANYLKEEGFDTVLCGVQHEIHGNPKELGYCHVYTEHPFADDDFIKIDDKSTKDAVEYLKQEHKQPFFLSLGLMNTHRNFPVVGAPTNPNYVAVPPLLPNCTETRTDFARYIDSAKTADECFGMLFHALDELNLWENTIVFFTTDHGIAFPKMKCNLYDTGIGVSLIFKYPGNKSAGAAVDAMVSHLDIFPTLCDLLELKHPDWLEGKSMMPLLNQEADSIREAVFSEINYHAAYEPMRCVRTERYKYIQRFDTYPHAVFCNVDDGNSKQLLLNYGWKERAPDAAMLFDLIYDPMEQNNLIEKLEYQVVLHSMQALLAQWMTDTQDPLLAGGVSKPQGARINRRSCMHSTDLDFE